MLALTRKTDYAIVALTDLAALAPGRASARQIAERCQVPLPMLMNILKELLNKGLITSTRGTKGGYSLEKSPGEITLAELIQAVEGPVRLTACCEDQQEHVEKKCDLEETCPTRSPMQKVNALLYQFLSNVTLRDIATDQLPIELSIPNRVRTRHQPSPAMT